MKSIHHVLLIVWLLELAGLTAYVATRPKHPDPPQPDLSLVDPITAKALTDSRAALDFSTYEGWSELASLYVSFGYFPEADACYSYARTLNPNDPDLKHWHARCLARMGMVDEAIALLAPVVNELPTEKQPEVYFHLGRLYLRAERLDEAKASFDKASTFGHTAIEQARILLREDKPAQAMQHLLPVLNQHPRERHLLRFASHAATAANRPVEAELFRSRTLWSVADFNGITRFEHLAKVREKIGAGAIEPQVIEAVDAKRFDEARGKLSELLENDWSPDNALFAARSYFMMGDLDAALESVQTYIARMGADADALDHLGQVHYLRGEFNEAKVAWERSYKLGRYPRAAAQLRKLSMETADFAAAKVWGRRALEELGIASFLAGNMQAAFAQLNQVVQEDPTNARALYYLAHVFIAGNKLSEAFAAVSASAEADPDYGRAHRLRDQLRRGMAQVPMRAPERDETE